MKVTDNGARPTAAIFDLDGTLYPREAYVGQVLAVIAEMLVQLRGLTPAAADAELDDLRRAMREDWDRTSSTSWVLARGFTIEQWRDFRARYLSIAAGVAPDPSVVAAVARLRGRLRVALLSNNTRDAAEAILTRIGFPAGAFDAVVTSEDVGATPKPDPRAFRVVLAALRAEPAGAWGVGDRYDIDVEPLQRLGGAGLTVAGPQELPSAVDDLLARIAH